MKALVDPSLTESISPRMSLLTRPKKGLIELFLEIRSAYVGAAPLRPLEQRWLVVALAAHAHL